MKKAILLLISSLAILPVKAQFTTLAIQDFDTIQNPVWNYTGNGITYVKGNSASVDGPASSPFGIGGSWAWETTQQSAGDTLIFSNVNISGYDSVYITWRQAGFSIGSQNDGPDQLDQVLGMVSVDGGITYYNRLRIEGNSQSFWAYSATGLAIDNFMTNNTTTVFGPAGSGLRTTDGYSTAKIFFPNNTYTQVRLKIRSRESTSGERWCIDNVAVLGKLKTGYLNAGNLDKHVSLFPNPANTELNITINASGNVPAVYRICDLLGNEVTGGTSETGTFRINTSALAAGTYLVSLETEMGKVVRKVSVTH